MKNITIFMFENWVKTGFRWKSPYHEIAGSKFFEARQRVVNLLLDYGYIKRASLLLAKRNNKNWISARARLKFLQGDSEQALALLDNGFVSTTSPSEKDRLIKLYARLAPYELISKLIDTGKAELASQFLAAIELRNCGSLPYPKAIADQHLINANHETDPEGKLRHLNQYWTEMGLSRQRLAPNSSAFDINAIESHNCWTQTAPIIPAAVSVIMTVHNGAQYLRAACVSILQQLEVSTEIVIIDDGSSDQSWEIIDSIQRDYPHRVVSRRLATNIGTYRAKNVALSICRSEYVAFQDADDWSHPERLLRAINWLRADRQCVAVTSRYVRLGEDGLFHSPSVWPIRQWSPNTLVMRRTEVIDRIGGFDPVKVGADTDFFERLRSTFGDQRIKFQNEVLLLAMSLPTSLMHNSSTGIDKHGYSARRIEYREHSAERILKAALENRAPYIPIQLDRLG